MRELVEHSAIGVIASRSESVTPAPHMQTKRSGIQFQGRYEKVLKRCRHDKKIWRCLFFNRPSVILFNTDIIFLPALFLLNICKIFLSDSIVQNILHFDGIYQTLSSIM